MSWSGFYKLSLEERVARVADHADLDAAERNALSQALSPADADTFIENAVGSFALPLGVAVGFRIDGKDTVVPMAVEESSVIAAASHGAKIARAGGGFETDVMPPVTLGQVEVRDVEDPKAGMRAIREHQDRWMQRLDETMPSMVARGGGLRRITARPVGPDRVVVHLHVDCRDAMGANLVNTLCEAIADEVAEVAGGRRGLRILSNLADERLATARTRIPFEAVGGRDVAAAMVEANEFALLDPYRAATHNKGIMNGVDPVAVATGNDWRALEAGAHAFAARDGTYRGLTRYRLADDALVAELTLPVSVGTVGGVTTLHPTARTCLRILGSPDAARLAGIIASVGLAQNLSALRALAAEGIQAGHMALHARNVARQAGLQGEEADRVAARMAETGEVSVSRAKELAGDEQP